MKKIASISMLILVFAGLSLGTLRAAFFPKEINNYESRMANRLPAWSISAFLSGGFQQDVEAALSDQFPFSQHLKKAYHELSSAWIKWTLRPVLAENPDTAVLYNGYRLYHGYLIYDRRDPETMLPHYETVLESYNRAMEANPETRFFFYYVESDTTCDIVSGVKNPSFELLRQRSHAPAGAFGRLQVDGFEQFGEYFRKTDHHWNHKGSYRAYTDILSMMGLEEEALRPAGKAVVSRSYVGTKGVGSRLPAFAEEAEVYFFDYPELGASYGGEELYRRGERTDFTYSNFYGGDEAEFCFDTGRPERENLLLLGDSMDNAVVKLLASHFNKTHSVDLRHYVDEAGNPGLNISEYIRQHDIDRVLVIGSDFLYADPTFAVRS